MLLSKLLPLALSSCVVHSYGGTASSALTHLKWSTDHVATYVNRTQACGFNNTTQAILQNAIDPSGSACPAADESIARKLHTFVDDLTVTGTSLFHARERNNASDMLIAERFHDFSASFYNLFNALDLAQCTFGLTASSATYSIALPKHDNTLVTAYENIVGELNRTVRPQISAANFDLAMHFWGTNLLANVMGTSKDIELQACETITEIINRKGGVHVSLDVY
ncbi:MAG: hypothetical protein M1831_002547 [Alyxoria varia]|nr:MAG: hypothetical protein M1831_002547 [Alyxoria varia]